MHFCYGIKSCCQAKTLRKWQPYVRRRGRNNSSTCFENIFQFNGENYEILSGAPGLLLEAQMRIYARAEIVVYRAR